MLSLFSLRPHSIYIAMLGDIVDNNIEAQVRKEKIGSLKCNRKRVNDMMHFKRKNASHVFTVRQKSKNHWGRDNRGSKIADSCEWEGLCNVNYRIVVSDCYYRWHLSCDKFTVHSVLKMIWYKCFLESLSRLLILGELLKNTWNKLL